MAGFMLFPSCERKKHQSTGLIVEDAIAIDTVFMNETYDNYRWFETCVTLENFLDEDSVGNYVKDITNIFQTALADGTSFDVNVVFRKHTQDYSTYDVKHGFWIEDMPLVKDDIKLTFQEAYDKVMATNCPKPHSRNCVLRKELGPKNANPQYIFGNSKAQLYVDAVTGKVTDKNPVFPEEAGFKMPLGEWP